MKYKEMNKLLFLAAFLLLMVNISFANKSLININTTIFSDSIIGPDLVCGIDTTSFIVIPDDPNSTYVWEFDEGVSLDGTNIDSIENISWPIEYQGTTRTITVVITDSDGSQQTVFKNVYISTGVFFDGQIMYSRCQGGSLTIGPSVDEVTLGATYSWQPNFYLSNPNVRQPVCTPPYDICYNLIITIGECSKEVEICVIVDSTLNPKADAGLDMTICGLEELVLGGNPTASPVGGYAILGQDWRPNSAFTDPYIPNPTVNPTITTTYEVIIFSEDGCTDTSSVTVFVEEPISITLDSINDVSNDNFGLISISSNGEYDYNWTGPDGFSSNEEDLLDLQNGGCYELMISGENTICTLDTVICINDLTSIGNQENNGTDILFYPNPSYGNLIIDFNENIISTAIISIFNMKGELFFEKEVDSINGFIVLNQLDIREGLYLIELCHEKGMSRGKVFFKD